MLVKGRRDIAMEVEGASRPLSHGLLRVSCVEGDVSIKGSLQSLAFVAISSARQHKHSRSTLHHIKARGNEQIAHASHITCAGHVDLVKHLLRRGKVDIVATNKGGRTALELAPDESTRQAIRAAIESAAAARSVDAMETEGPADGGEGSNPSDSKQKKRRAGSRKRPHAEAGGEEAEEEAAQPSASIGPSIGPSMLSIGPSVGPSMPSIGPSMPPGFVVDGSAPKDEDGQGKETERSPAIEPAIGTAGAQEGSDASLSRGAQLPVNDAKGQRQNGTQGTGSVPAVPPSSGSVAEGTRHPRKISRVALSHLDDDDDDVF